MAEINPAEGGVHVVGTRGPEYLVSQRLYDALQDYERASGEWAFMLVPRLVAELKSDARREKGKRRKRSELTEADCLEVLRGFASRVNRMMESSEPFTPCGDIPEGTITIKFQVRGSFGTGDRIFEAIRVMAGHKLPAKEETP
jgi:hypothetical protein